LTHVQRLAIRFRKYGYGSHAKLLTRTIDAKRDLAAIGD
jgi:hypothetical protein